MKKSRLTGLQLHKVVTESVNKILSENANLDLDNLYNQLDELRAKLSHKEYLNYQESFTQILGLIANLMRQEPNRISFKDSDFN
jgi:hypothetical protein